MSEQTVREADRRKLNVIEGLILTAMVGVVVTLLALRQSVAEQAVVMRFQTEEIGRLRSQLADVPALSQRVSRLEVRMDNTEAQVKEVRSMRGLQ